MAKNEGLVTDRYCNNNNAQQKLMKLIEAAVKLEKFAKNIMIALSKKSTLEEETEDVDIHLGRVVMKDIAQSINDLCQEIKAYKQLWNFKSDILIPTDLEPKAEQQNYSDFHHKLLSLRDSPVLPENIKEKLNMLSNDQFLQKNTNKMLAIKTLNDLSQQKNKLASQEAMDALFQKEFRGIVDQQTLDAYNLLSSQIKTLGELDTLEFMVKEYGSLSK